jgi:adenylate cyclase
MSSRSISVLERAHPWLIALGAGLVVSASAIGLRELGVWEAVELAIYDRLVASTRDSEPARSKVVLIEARDSDLDLHGFPLSDEVLARAVAAMLRLQPRAVGVDFFRSRPEGAGEPELMRVVLGDSRVVMVEVAGQTGRDIPPPGWLDGSSQVGFADFVNDEDRKVRRGLVFMQSEGTGVSLGLRLAKKYLDGEPGTEPSLRVESGTFLLKGHPIPRFAGGDGAYVDADDAGYQTLMDFRGAFPHLERYSLTELLDGRVPERALQGRVVLFGATAESAKDHHLTPAERAYGVELHALLVQRLLEHGLHGAPGIRTLEAAYESGLVAAFGVAGALFLLLTESGLIRAAAVAAVPLGIAWVSSAAFAQGWWLPGFPVGLSWVACFLTSTTVLSLRERQEQRRLQDLFGRLVSPEIAREVWKRREDFLGGNRPRAEHATITALVGDLEGFTAACEKLEPVELMDWTNLYMGAMTAVISRHRGIVDDYAGDGIKADFGLLVRDPSADQIAGDAIAAVDCALELERTFRQLAREADETGRHPARGRVGIFTGPVVVGLVGSPDRLKFTTLGDTVNTAARLESYDKESFKSETASVLRILVGEPTRALFGDRYELEDLGAAALKGKAEPVRIYRVLGLAKAEQRREGGTS